MESSLSNFFFAISVRHHISVARSLWLLETFDQGTVPRLTERVRERKRDTLTQGGGGWGSPACLLLSFLFLNVSVVCSPFVARSSWLCVKLTREHLLELYLVEGATPHSGTSS